MAVGSLRSRKQLLLHTLLLLLRVVAESCELVVGEVDSGGLRSSPVLGGRKVLDHVVGQIKSGQVVQLRDVARYLSQLIVGEIQPLQRVHPVAGRTDRQVRELVVRGIQVHLPKQHCMS